MISRILIVLKSYNDIMKVKNNSYNRGVICDEAKSITLYCVKSKNIERGNTFYGKEKFVF